jgi:RIO-like serine/threonine protein kinase
MAVIGIWWETFLKIIKDYPCSKVWLDGGHIYKWQPKFLTENEFWCLKKMASSGFVPDAKRVDLEIIKMEFIEHECPTDAELLFKNVEQALSALACHGIRHGDLTSPNVLIRQNKPILLDFSESRLVIDPRADKRLEGDRYWLNHTVWETLKKCWAL